MLVDQRRNPFFRYRKAQLFLAWRGGRVVGRIAAVDDQPAVASPDRPYGGVGLFECLDDEEAACALFEEARRWLRERGRHELLGPLNLSTNHGCGLLIDAFEHSPSALMPYNHPYYLRLFEAAGLVKAKDLLAWEFNLDASPPLRVLRVSNLMATYGTVTVRPPDFASFTRDVRTLMNLYNTIWRPNWGFTPMTEAEFFHLIGGLRSLIRCGATFIAEVKGRPVGFVMLLSTPHLRGRVANGQLFSRMGITFDGVRMPRALRKSDSGRIIAMGVLKEFRGSGAGALLLDSALKAARQQGKRTVEGSWTLMDNHDVNRLIIGFGGVHTKTYRLYQQGF
ncbi:GNAT family N-acetyltransferase [Streptomyces sp. NPDC055036]